MTRPALVVHYYYDDNNLYNDNNLEEQHDERRQPLVGHRGQRAIRRSRRLRRMRRRAGGDAAGCEASEAVRKSRQVCGLRSGAEDVCSLARLERDEQGR